MRLGKPSGWRPLHPRCCCDLILFHIRERWESVFFFLSVGIVYSWGCEGKLVRRRRKELPYLLCKGYVPHAAGCVVNIRGASVSSGWLKGRRGVYFNVYERGANRYCVFVCVNSERGDGPFLDSSVFFNCNSFQRCTLCARTHFLSLSRLPSEGRWFPGVHHNFIFLTSVRSFFWSTSIRRVHGWRGVISDADCE